MSSDLTEKLIMNREELEEVFNRVYVGQYKKKEKKKVDGSKTLDRNYFSRHRRVCNLTYTNYFQMKFSLLAIRADRGF